ncbi:Palmitoyltransferase [Venturia nashicola]|nr:Palmitoyltransferase [Venturia nashicola]
MKLVLDSLVGTTNKVPSNASTPTIYETELNSSVENLAKLSDAPNFFEVIPDKVSDLELSYDEDTSVTLISTGILEIIFDYALNKFDDCRDRLEAGRPRFISVLNKFVRVGQRVDMCLPAFPFKSANKVYKAFGVLPDKAEEIALARLHNMCQRIEEIYPPGARVVLISDGLVYNDLLCISDRDTWLYGQALREMSEEMGFTNIGFSRLNDFVDFNLPEALDEIHYVANATNFRRFILNKFGKDDLDVDHLIATDEDTRLTYQGHRRFLMSDLKHIFTVGADRTSNAYKRQTKYLAKQMLVRGYAFAVAIKAKFPNHLRLSIHQSTGEHKVSMSLLNTKTGFTTPWHCSAAQMADGEWVSAPMGDFKHKPRMKVVEEKGRPSYFREMTEEEYVEEQRVAEQSAQRPEVEKMEEKKPEVDEARHEPQVDAARNENFVYWDHLAYEVVSEDETSRLRVLDQAGGWLRGGTLTALIGVNEAGTTELLNVLAKPPTSGVLHGDILVNGRPRNAASQNLAGLVPQQDLHFAGATVKEALIFSAVLRQPKTTSYVKKMAHADEVINLVGLEAVADTVIGHASSSLDSQAALSICALLRKIAQTGLAILCTVTQPSARVLQSFDRLLLLGKGGKQLFFGKTGPGCKTIASYFERNGARSREATESLAEWMLEITDATDDSENSKDWSQIWKDSPERKAMEEKLIRLKNKFSASPEFSINSSTSSERAPASANAIDAVALERTFHKYLFLENIQLPTDSPGCWHIHQASLPRPAYLL